MRTNRLSLPAGCGLLIAIGCGIASAPIATSAAPPAAPAPAFAAPASIHAGTREYVWTVYLPVVTTEHVEAVIEVLAPRVHGRRWDYELPGLKSERFKLGQVAEFSCKYGDWELPNECRTEWHDVYADLPVLAMQRDHVDYDEVDWAWEERTVGIDVARWSWRAGTLTFSVPVFGPEETARAQATLDADRAATAKAIDKGLDTLGASIAAVEAQGGDPRHLSTGGGTSVDLPAMQQTLRDEKAKELDRLARIRDEITNLGTIAPDTRETPTAAP